MEFNEPFGATDKKHGNLCVLLRSVTLRILTTDVLQVSNSTITASGRRGKFVAVDMGLVSSNAVQVFFFLSVAVSTLFTRQRQNAPKPHSTTTATQNVRTERNP
jgi:hypothetical protein